MSRLRFTEQEVTIIEEALSDMLSCHYTVDPHPMGPTTNPDGSRRVQLIKNLLKRFMKARGVSDEEIKSYIEECSIKHF